MQRHNRRDVGPPKDEIDELATSYVESLPPPKYELPREVIDRLIHVRNYLYRLASRIVDEDYDGEGTRDGVSIDCECFGEKLQDLLEECGHGIERYPSWWPEECKEPGDCSSAEGRR